MSILFNHQSVTSQHVIAPNLHLEGVRELRISFLAIVFSFLGGSAWAWGSSVLGLSDAWNFRKEGAFFVALPLILWIFIAILFFFCLSILAYKLERYWKRIEPLRFEAASESCHLLADEQSQPISVDLSFPVTLTTNTSRLALWAIWLFCMVSLGVEIFLITRFVSGPGVPPLFAPVCMSIYGFLLLNCTWICFSRCSKCREITITSEGITGRSRVFSRNDILQVVTVSMLWHEARLFACYPAWGSRKSRGVMIYELSSATQIVRWAWVRHRNPLHNLEVPVVSLDEHNAQMQRLCELVVAKTGLPLYDLGKAL